MIVQCKLVKKVTGEPVYRFPTGYRFSERTGRQPEHLVTLYTTADSHFTQTVVDILIT